MNNVSDEGRAVRLILPRPEGLPEYVTSLDGE